MFKRNYDIEECLLLPPNTLRRWLPLQVPRPCQPSGLHQSISHSPPSPLAFPPGESPFSLGSPSSDSTCIQTRVKSHAASKRSKAAPPPASKQACPCAVHPTQSTVAKEGKHACPCMTSGCPRRRAPAGRCRAVDSGSAQGSFPSIAGRNRKTNQQLQHRQPGRRQHCRAIDCQDNSFLSGAFEGVG